MSILARKLGAVPAAAALVAVLLGGAGCDLLADREGSRLSERAVRMWEEGRYHEAARTFVGLSEVRPNSGLGQQALYWAANLYHYYLEDLERAAQYYQELTVRFPDGRYYYDAKEQLAELYEQKPESHHLALQLYQQLVLADELASRHPYFQYQIARINLEMGKLDQARLALRELLERFPQSEYTPEGYYMVGFSYYLEKRYQLALAVLRKTADRFSDHPISKRAEFLRADTLEEQGQMKEALAVFTDLREDYPNPEIVQRRIRALEGRLRRGVR